MRRFTYTFDEKITSFIRCRKKNAVRRFTAYGSGNILTAGNAVWKTEDLRQICDADVRLRIVLTMVETLSLN